jgi:hypothetical protein
MYFCELFPLTSNQNVENGTSKLPGAGGVGLQKALQGYARWFKKVYFPGCELKFLTELLQLLTVSLACANYGYWSDPSTTACFNTYNASSPIFTDVSVNNTVDRQWQWFLCNEPLFYWQEYVVLHSRSYCFY